MRIALAFLAVTAFAVPALAAPHDGVYLRAQFGLGGAVAVDQLYDNPNAKVTYYGGAGWLNLEAGHAVKAPFILYAKGFHMRAPSPKLSVGGIDTQTDNTGYMTGIGGGMTYYFLPSNFYVSGALCFTVLGIRNKSGDRFETNVGMTAHAGAGIEFYTGSDLALGVGAELASGLFPDKIAADHVFWSGGFLGLTLNATYN